MESHGFSIEEVCPDPIRKRFEHENFHCPECQDAPEDEEFTAGCGCPERIPQPKLPSPNSGLPQAELRELKECIEEINQFLRDIGNPRNANNLRGLQLRFQGLKNQFARIKVNCGMKEQEFTGGIADAGRDFILLDDLEQTILIPFGRILSIQYAHGGKHSGHEQGLLDIDPCLRRNLILDFANTVSKSPHLINLFFGISMELYLVSLIGCKIEVTAVSGKRLGSLSGELVKAGGQSIGIRAAGKNAELNMDDICFIKIPE